LRLAQNNIREIKSKRMRWAGNVARMGDTRSIYKILVGKLGRKRPRGRRRCRWEDNSRIDLGEIGGENVDWIHVVQDRDQWWALVNNKVMNIQIP
jgi:hypothetical protein